MKLGKTFKEIYEEIKKPLMRIIEIADRDLKTHFSLRLSEKALEEIESEYQKIIEILKDFQPQNEAEEKIQKYALQEKGDRFKQAVYIYIWSKELLEKEN